MSSRSAREALDVGRFTQLGVDRATKLFEIVRRVRAVVTGDEERNVVLAEIKRSEHDAAALQLDALLDVGLGRRNRLRFHEISLRLCGDVIAPAGWYIDHVLTIFL